MNLRLSEKKSLRQKLELKRQVFTFTFISKKNCYSISWLQGI